MKKIGNKIMTGINSNIHNRRSIRLKGYDYSRAGLYFITICCQGRESLFGNITDDIMILNDAGTMVEKWFFEIENKFPDIKCGGMVVMPNHFHCIIENVGIHTGTDVVGADLCVCPNNAQTMDPIHPQNKNENICQSHRMNPIHPQNKNENICQSHRMNPMDGNEGEHIGSPLHGSPLHGSPLHGSPLHGSSLCHVVQWLKTMTTNEYIRGVKNNIFPPFNKRIWQRNYWEHIIRNENEYCRIAQYIVENPIKWETDKLNGRKGNVVLESLSEYDTEIWMT